MIWVKDSWATRMQWWYDNPIRKLRFVTEHSIGTCISIFQHWRSSFNCSILTAHLSKQKEKVTFWARKTVLLRILLVQRYIQTCIALRLPYVLLVSRSCKNDIANDMTMTTAENWADWNLEESNIWPYAIPMGTIKHGNVVIIESHRFDTECIDADCGETNMSRPSHCSDRLYDVHEFKLRLWPVFMRDTQQNWYNNVRFVTDIEILLLKLPCGGCRCRKPRLTQAMV